MKKHIETRIQIQASSTQVWKVLTDFESHSKWNPFIKQLKGKLAVGETLDVFIQAPGSKGMQFKPTVMELEVNKRFVWLGKLFIKGLFDGRHYFQLMDNGDGSTTLIHGEDFSGILVRFVNLDGTKVGFEAMNNELKKVVEKG